MAELVAVAAQGGLALFREGDVGVVVDTETLNPCDPKPLSSILAGGGWITNDDDTSIYASSTAYEIADAAISVAGEVVELTAAGPRTVRVPRRVQEAVRESYAVLQANDVDMPQDAAATALALASGTVTTDTVQQVHLSLACGEDSLYYKLYGGDTARQWTSKFTNEPIIVAAAPTPSSDPADPTLETDWTDPEKPHVFVLLAPDDSDCAICSKPQDDPIHVMDEAESANDAPGPTYFATFAPGGDMGPTFKVDAVYALDEEGHWWHRELGDWLPTQALDETQDVLQLDQESFEAASRQLDEPGTAYAELSISEERLHELAAPDLNYELLDAVFAAAPYIPPEVRSANAKKQMRDAKGHFIMQGGVVQDAAGDRGTVARVDHDNGTVEIKGQDGQTKTVPANTVSVDHNAAANTPAAAPKAKLPSALPLVPDVNGLIASFQQKWAQEQGSAVTAAGDENLIPPDDGPSSATPTSTGPSAPAPDDAAPDSGDDPVAAAGVTPLYLAEVDKDDTQAVLDCFAIIPAKAQGDQIEVYKRNGGSWQLDDADRATLQGPTPPPLVQLDQSMLDNVIQQIDANPQPTDAPADAPVAASLRALAASGRALMQRFELTESGLTASQVAGAQLLQSYGEHNTWPYDIKHRLNEFVAGQEVSPKDVKNTDRLKFYWEHGEGAAKIQWGVPGDYMRCVHHLEKYLGKRAYGYCQLRHKGATGFYAGHAPTEQEPHARAASAATDEALVAAPGDPLHDLPHAFDMGNDDSPLFDGNCAGCGRGEEHPLHVVFVIPSAQSHEDAEAVQPHEFNPGPEGLCECGKPVDDPIHTLTDSPVADTQDDYDGHNDFDYSVRHAFTIVLDEGADPNECDCGRPRNDRMHSLVAAATDVVTPGQRFRIPLVVPEGVQSGDGRTFAKNSLTSRPMPLALMWQPEGDEGHKGSVIVGRVDHVERTDQGLGNAYGVFDTGQHGQEALRLVRAGMLRGISADLDEFEADVLDTHGETNDNEDGPDENASPKPDKITAQKMMVNKGRLMGVTLVAKPAYAECTIELVDGDENMDGPWQQETGEARVAALVAAGVPLHPPAEWFENPKLDKPTHLTVTDDGRVFGHIASWEVDHIGLPFGTRAPRSVSNYAYFRTGSLHTAEGKVVRVGQLTLTGGHAPLQADARTAVKHYDDTASAVADLAAGEDKHGIWVSGALRPGVTPSQVRAIRAASPSGDWRPIKGALELVAVCQVNVPGFPVAEAMVAGGQVMALVAAGVLATPRTQLSQDEIDRRIARLEAAEMKRTEERVREAQARIAPVREAKQAALAASAAKARERIDVVRQEKKVKLEARVAAARAKVAAGGLHVSGDFEEKHPRDNAGRFREVLARLEKLLTGDARKQAGGAIQQVEDAAGKEEAGDNHGAAQAAREGVRKLEEAAHAAGDPVKATLLDAANAVRDAADAHDGPDGEGGDEAAGAAEIMFDALAEPIKEQLSEAIARAEEKADPVNPDEALSKAKAFITGTRAWSVRDIQKFIKNQLKRETQPHVVSPGSGPSPTSPTVKGPQGPQIGNGPVPS